MTWILEHLQLVLIVGLGLAGWLKSRYDAQNEAQEHEEEEILAPPTNRPVPTRPPPMPRTGAPPPLVSLSAVHEQDARELRRQQELAERLRIIRENTKPRKSSAGQATAGRARGTPQRGAAAAAKPGLTLRNRLHDPAEIRAAVVLREVLDRPVGLR